LGFGAGGTPFPFRDLVIFLTFTVILVTLVGGGLTLPAVIRVLKISEERDEEAGDLRRALAGVSVAALARIDSLVREGSIDRKHAATLRERYERKRNSARRDREDAELTEVRCRSDAEREVIVAERLAPVRMRQNGEIDNAVLRSVQSRLDQAEQHITDRE